MLQTDWRTREVQKCIPFVGLGVKNESLTLQLTHFSLRRLCDLEEYKNDKDIVLWQHAFYDVG